MSPFERTRPIERTTVKITLEADVDSLRSVSQKLGGQKISHGSLSATVADSMDPQQAVDQVRRAGDSIRAVLGQTRKEFK
jgi:hypothetical protein